MSKALMTGKEQTATGTTLGVVKLSDAGNASQGADSGYAVTPKAISKQVTSRSPFREVFVWRNLQLTFTNGSATFDATELVGASSAVVGFAMFPYNNIEVSKVTAGDGVFTVSCTNKTVNGAYYTSVVIFF